MLRAEKRVLLFGNATIISYKSGFDLRNLRQVVNKIFVSSILYPYFVLPFKPQAFRTCTRVGSLNPTNP